MAMKERYGEECSLEIAAPRWNLGRLAEEVVVVRMTMFWVEREARNN